MSAFTRTINKIRTFFRGETMPVFSELKSSLAPHQQKWKSTYEGHPPWESNIVRPTNMGTIAASEIARLVMLEYDGEFSEELENEIFQRQVVRGFLDRYEKTLALGGCVMKPYTVNGIVHIDFAYPTTYIISDMDTDGTILDITFLDYQIAPNGEEAFIRLERHLFERAETRYIITNRVYRSDKNAKIDVANIGAILGGAETLDFSVIPEWAEKAREFEMQNIIAPLHAYIKPAVANHIDSASSEAVSIFARAMEVMQRIDEHIAGLVREFAVKEARIHVDERAIQPELEAGTLPHLKYDLYKGLRTAVGESSFFSIFSPEIYSQQHLDVLDEYFRQFEDAVGLAHGTWSKPERVQRTAAEVTAQKHKTAVTVTSNQQNLQDAFEQLAYAISVWTHYPAIPPEIEVTPSWDDSQWRDYDAEVKSMQEDVARGLIRPEIYLMKRYRVTEEEALKMMPGSEDLAREANELIIQQGGVR